MQCRVTANIHAVITGACAASRVTRVIRVSRVSHWPVNVPNCYINSAVLDWLSTLLLNSFRDKLQLHVKLMLERVRFYE